MADKDLPMTPDSTRPRLLPALAVGVAVALTLQLFGGTGSAAPANVPSARAALEAASQRRVEAEQRLASVEAEVGLVRAEIQRLDDGAAQITEDLAAARRAVREYAVAAYIDGGQGALLGATLDVEESSALAWRAQVVGSQTVDAADAVDRFSALKDSNEPDQIAAAARLDDLTATLEEVHSDALQAAAHERDAEAALERALDYEQRMRAAAAEQAEAQRDTAEATTVTTAAPASSTGGSSGRSASKSASTPAPAPAAVGVPATGQPTQAEIAMLAKIRHCESRGNYSIASASGKYRGAYQFDQRTWNSVGGSGDPAAASPAEQDYRALLLYRQRGRRPWPNCA